MVSTEKQYKTDNFPILRNANLRGEHLYQVRLYTEWAAFLSPQSGNMRMKVLLAFIEARAAVIDAIIKTDGTLHYLCVVCSSVAGPTMFSGILKHTVPRAIIEELDTRHAEELIASRAVRDETWNVIPLAGAIHTVHESRRLLLALLLEYRALLAEYNAVLPSPDLYRRSANRAEFSIPVLLFEQDGLICGVPDFQIESVSPGANGSQIINLVHGVGQRIVIADELICIKELDIISCSFLGKHSRGYYKISTAVTGGTFDFTLIVPSFL